MEKISEGVAFRNVASVRAFAGRNQPIMSHFFITLRSLLSNAREYVGLAVACAVVAFGASQIRVQLDRWRRPEAHYGGLSERGRRFFKRQAFRRLQIAALSLVVGAIMAGGLLALDSGRVALASVLWLTAIILGGWICVLALVDALAVWLSFEDDRQKVDAEKITLEYKMKKFQEECLQEKSNERDESTATDVDSQE